MEEVQCALLGFAGSETTCISAELRSSLHPTEYHLIMESLPMGRLYDKLQRFWDLVASGGCLGYLANALGHAVREILTAYEHDVTSCTTVATLEVLTHTYPVPFQDLWRMIQQVSETEVLIIHLNRFQRTLEYPEVHRTILGEKVACAVLYYVAHLVGNGALLAGSHKDFFVTDFNGAATGILGHMEDGDEVTGGDASPSDGAVFQLHRRRIPCEIPLELAQSIVAAGTERFCLERQLRSGSGLALLRDGQRIEDVSRAIFSSIFNPSLWRGGRVLAEELAVRVEAARSLWSKALWATVGEIRILGSCITLLRDVFLGHRGDLWAVFVERSFPAVTGFVLRGHKLSQSGRSDAAVARAVREAFDFSLRVAGLSDVEDQPVAFSLRMETLRPLVHSMAVHDAAGAILERIECIHVAAEIPSSVSLVMTSIHLDQYQSLFTFQLRLRFALYALHEARRAIVTVSERVRGCGIARVDALGSDVRALMSKVSALHQFFLFVLTTVGHYFQLDVIEARFTAFFRDLKQNTSSTENAKHKHTTFLSDVTEAMFLFDESRHILDALQESAKAAFMLYVLTARAEHFFFSLSNTESGATPVRVSPDVVVSVSQLERVQEELVVILASRLSGATRPSERALWTRLDFSRYFSQGWHKRNTRSAASRGGQQSHAAVKGTPISLSSLVRQGGMSAPTQQQRSAVTTLHTTPIPSQPPSAAPSVLRSSSASSWASDPNGPATQQDF